MKPGRSQEEVDARGTFAKGLNKMSEDSCVLYRLQYETHSKMHVSLKCRKRT